MARDFTQRRWSEGRIVRGDATAGGKDSAVVYIAGVREKRREQGQDEVKLLFIDVKKAHLNAKGDEEDWVEWPNEFKKLGKYVRLKRWSENGRGDYARRLVSDGFQRDRAASTIFYHPKTHVTKATPGRCVVRSRESRVVRWF